MADPSESEQSLLERATRRAERDAFRALFDRHQRGLFAFCLLATGRDAVKAEALLAEVFTQAFGSLSTFEAHASFGALLYRLAAAKVRGHVESTALAEVLEAYALLQATSEPPTTDGDPTAQQVLKARLDAVDDEKTRQIAQAFYLERLSTKAVADKVATPVGTVTLKLTRFRDRVKRDLCKQLVEHQLGIGSPR